MCGIAAVLDPARRLPPGLVHQMLSHQHSRGPDAAGVVAEHGVTLGHQLLRILPCRWSRQPMESEDGSLAISFNGEIYDFPALRRGLEALGSRFFSDTDTEVVLELFREGGPGRLASLNGMFAFVLHDRRRGVVHLARDRFGQKPLYLRRARGATFVSSSLKSLLLPEMGARHVDPRALEEYLVTLDAGGSRCLCAGIEHVPPGCCLTFAEDGRLLGCEGFAALEFAPAAPAPDAAEAAEQLWALLRQSVRRQSYNVERLATHLSGGLDSSAVALCLHETRPLPFATFSCAYEASHGEGVLGEERGFEEFGHARELATAYGWVNIPVRVGPADYFRLLVDLIDSLEEPKGNPCLPHFMLARRIGLSHRVFLSGEGADELLGGYPWKLATAVGGGVAEIERRFFAALLPASRATIDGLYAPGVAASERVFHGFRERLGLAGGRTPLDAVMGYDLRHFLHYLLLQADKLAGRFGLEGRYPFLDNDLAAFALRLPAALRRGDLHSAKPVLRRCLAGRLPATLLARPKVGFVPPEGSWYGGELAPLVERFLLGPDSYVRSLVRPARLRVLWADHRAGRRNYRKLIWGLLSLDLWHRRCIQEVPRARLEEELIALPSRPGRGRPGAAPAVAQAAPPPRAS